MTTTEPDVYYDPYDFEIDTDPYPVWKRLRDERPLYYNERYGFYALSRFDDVERASVNWKTYISSKGAVVEMLNAEMAIHARCRPLKRAHQCVPQATMDITQRTSPRRA